MKNERLFSLLLISAVIVSLLLDFSLFTIPFFIVIFVLLYLAYYDFFKMEVHNVLSLSLLLTLCFLNLCFFFIEGSGYEITLGRYIFSPLNNLQGGIFLGAIFQLIVLISKEKALGQGDVRIAIIVGLILGSSNLVLWLYITIFTALAYSLLLWIRKKKFWGLKIPFVPFMILGVLLTLLFF